MSKTVTGVGLALLCLSPSALAQDLNAQPAHKVHATMRAGVKGETLDTSAARLAAKAAFQPQAQPTQQDLLNIIVLMSLREQRGSGT